MIKFETEGSTEIVSFGTDTLNALISEDVKDKINARVESGISRLIIDLDGVRYIDSSGFGCLLSVARSAKNNYCTVKYCSIEPEVFKVLELLHLHTVFSIYPDRESCLTSF
jgi:anti-sigma B factor antagonist